MESGTESYSQIMKRKIETMQQEAHWLLDEGKSGEAVKRLSRALALDPRNPHLYRQRAEALVATGDLPAAIQNVKKALSIGHPEYEQLQEGLARLHTQHGDSLELQGEHSAALEAFTRAGELFPHERRYTIRRVSCLFQLGRYDECLSLTEAELQAAVPSAELLTMKARLKLMFGNVTEAYYNVEDALQLEPENKSALDLREELSQRATAAKNQAVDYCLSGKEPEAVRKLTAAIQADPSQPRHHVFRGALHRQAGSFSAAVDDFLMAMDKCNHQRETAVYRDASRQLVLTYNDFAVECFRKKHYEDAVMLLNKAIKEERREPGLYTNRGDCFFKLGELQFALSDYQQACDLSGASDIGSSYRLAVVHHSIGTRFFSMGDYAAAEDHFSSAIRFSPLTAHFYLCRARAKHEMKDDHGAREDTLRALLLDPSSEDSVPITARLFPGQKVPDLVHSDMANGLRPSLLPSQHMEEKAPHSQHQRASYLCNLLEGLELRVEESDEKEEDVEDGRKDTKEKESTGVSGADDRHHSLTSSSCSIKRPRSRPVLHQPSPLLTPSMVPSLQACLRENEFHRLIYYSKKMCTKDVERLLNNQ